MEMFNTHRRDILTFDNYMDLKKPGFGGPGSAIELRDAKGNLNDKNPKLSGYRHTVERDPAFSHPVYNSTYKAMTHDLVYKQEKKKPFTYEDPYHTGIPVIEVDPLEEGKTYTSFKRFINEAEELLDEPSEEMNEPEYEYSEPEEEEEEVRAEATRSSQTFSNLREIEAKLKGFESSRGENYEEVIRANNYDVDSAYDYLEDQDLTKLEIKSIINNVFGEEEEDEYEEYGANPMDETPFGEKPDWVKELEAKSKGTEYEAGGNPGGCSECGDSDWMYGRADESFWSRMFGGEEEEFEPTEEEVKKKLLELGKMEFWLFSEPRYRKRGTSPLSKEGEMYTDLNNMQKGDYFWEWRDTLRDYLDAQGGSINLGPYHFELTEEGDIITTMSDRTDEGFFSKLFEAEKKTKTKSGEFNDEELLSTACRSWSRMSEESKKKYLAWSAKIIGGGPYDPGVACKSNAVDSVTSDGDRKMLKAIIDLDFLN